MPRADALVVVAVTLVTVFTDLAIAVVIGVVISALVFAWQHAKQISVEVRDDEQGRRIYALRGTLFFASVANFAEKFTPRNDPDEVIVEFRDARVMDHSALEAIDALAERYQQAGKKLHLRHLSPDCAELLHKARGMIEVNVMEDPHYHLADDRLG